MTKTVSKTRKPYGYWNIEANVRAEATPYNTKEEFKAGNQSAYHAARRLGILDELHFTSGLFRWTETSIRVKAKEYTSSYQLSSKTIGPRRC